MRIAIPLPSLTAAYVGAYTTGMEFGHTVYCNDRWI